MSTLALLLIIGLIAVLLGVAGGAFYIVRRDKARAGDFERDVLEADRALEAARAADKGWDPAELQRVAREGLASERSGFEYEELLLVLVDDKPGVEEDRARFVALAGADSLQLVLGRHPGGEWRVESVEQAALPRA